MRLHYLQHVPFENPGSILTWAKENGHAITSTQLYQNDALPEQQDFDWLVVMGGPMNIYEEEIYPWLAAEKLFIGEAIAAGKVIIGLCLGGQLIADVIGGKVTQNPHKEIGWLPIQLSEEVRSTPLFSFFPEQPIVFQWHGDTFSVLPDDATCIAQSDGTSLHSDNFFQILLNRFHSCSSLFYLFLLILPEPNNQELAECNKIPVFY